MKGVSGRNKNQTTTQTETRNTTQTDTQTDTRTVTQNKTRTETRTKTRNKIRTENVKSGKLVSAGRRKSAIRKSGAWLNGGSFRTSSKPNMVSFIHLTMNIFNYPLFYILGIYKYFLIHFSDTTITFHSNFYHTCTL